MADKYAFQIIDVPGATGGTQVRGINDGITFAELSGSYMLSAPNFPYPQGFALENGAAFTFGPSGQPYGLQNSAGGLNNTGQIAGFSGHFTETERGYLYTTASGGSFTPVLASNGNPAETITTAYGVNDRGVVVGAVSNLAYQQGGNTTAFTWTAAGGMHQINIPGAVSSVATGDNDRGDVVGHTSHGVGTPDQGFLYSNGRLSTVNVHGAASTDPMGINNNETIVGYYSDGTHTHGFVDQGGQMTFINAPGATDTWVMSDNDFGQIAGYYKDATGLLHGFVATPGNGGNLASLAEMAPLPSVVQRLTGASSGHAYFDPSLPVNVVAVAHA